MNFFTCDVPAVLAELEDAFPAPEVCYSFHAGMFPGEIKRKVCVEAHLPPPGDAGLLRIVPPSFDIDFFDDSEDEDDDGEGSKLDSDRGGALGGGR